VSAIAHGVGLNMTVLSYEDRLDFAIVTDRDQVPDPWPLIDALRADLEALKAAAADGCAIPTAIEAPIRSTGLARA
jgi:diacylglycerol O-acyltransferase